MSCRRLPSRTARHAALNLLLQRALREAGIPARLEPPGLTRTDGKRPDGSTLFPWAEGRLMAWDVTCVDPICTSYVAASSKSALAAATAAETRKFRKYSTLPSDYVFAPLAFETLGGLGPSCARTLSQLGTLLCQKKSDPAQASLLYRALSVALQRGNAAAVMESLEDRAEHELDRARSVTRSYATGPHAHSCAGNATGSRLHCHAPT